jgi:hypothetical protein
LALAAYNAGEGQLDVILNVLPEQATAVIRRMALLAFDLSKPLSTTAIDLSHYCSLHAIEIH